MRHNAHARGQIWIKICQICLFSCDGHVKGILGCLGIVTLSLIWPVILMEVIEEHLQSFSVEWAKELHPTQVSKSVDVCVRVGGKGSGVGSRILFSVFHAIVFNVPNVPLEKGVYRDCFPSTLDTMWTVKTRQLCAKGSERELEKFAAVWSIKTADSICVMFVCWRLLIHVCIVCVRVHIKNESFQEHGKNESGQFIFGSPQEKSEGEEQFTLKVLKWLSARAHKLPCHLWDIYAYHKLTEKKCLGTLKVKQTLFTFLPPTQAQLAGVPVG